MNSLGIWNVIALAITWYFFPLSVISGRCCSAHMGLSSCLDPSLIQFMIMFKLAHLQPPMQTFLRLCSPYTGELLRNKATHFTTKFRSLQMEVFHVCYFSGQSLKSTLGGQWKVTCMYLFLQHAPDKHSNMPSDGTVHELTRNVSWRDFKI